MSEHSFGIELKQKNRNSIYRLIHKEGCVSKQSITRQLGLSLPTVTQNINELMERNLVREQGSFGNTGGRRARGYMAVPDARVAIGVDLNKQHLAVVAVDLQGNVLGHTRKYQAFENTDRYYKDVGEAVNGLVADLHLSRDSILGVGLAVQGIVSPDGQQVLYGKILKITGVSVEQMGKYIPYPHMLFHDSDMAAYAEYWFRQDLRQAVYISLSTNLGGSLIGGKAMRQNVYGLARIEHTTLVPGGRQCYCGQLGCADAYCSTYLLTDATPDGRLDTFFSLLQQGNPTAQAVWSEYMKNAAIMINNVHIMFDSPVVLGGYLAEYLDDHLEDIKALTYSRNGFNSEEDYLELSLVREEPVSVGTALKYIESFIASV